ncbi:hypothetical protein H8D85_01505 [bacterium]|nr:hypothetical protein [bacterium]
MKKEAVSAKKIKILNTIFKKTIKGKKKADSIRKAHESVATGSSIVRVRKPKTIAPINKLPDGDSAILMPRTSLLPDTKPILTPKVTSKIKSGIKPRPNKKNIIDAEFTEMPKKKPKSPDDVLLKLTGGKNKSPKPKAQEVRERWENIISTTDTPIAVPKGKIHGNNLPGTPKWESSITDTPDFGKYPKTLEVPKSPEIPRTPVMPSSTINMPKSNTNAPPISPTPPTLPNPTVNPLPVTNSPATSVGTLGTANSATSTTRGAGILSQYGDTKTPWLVAGGAGALIYASREKNAGLSKLGFLSRSKPLN